MSDPGDHSILISRTDSIGVSVDLHLSQPLHLSLGVPQGSILGPTLFSIATGDIPYAVKNSHIYLYADDFFFQLQQAFINLRLSLNAAKTKDKIR